MEDLFIRLVNMSITASWLVLAVVLLRFVLKKAPKWIRCVLWGLVGVRLVCPVSFVSILSLIPSSETVPSDIAMSPNPEIYSGVSFLNSTVNPIIRESFSPNPAKSVNPLQIVIFVATVLWIIGIVGMIIYTAVGYIKIKLQVREAVIVEDNIYECDRIATPFILGFVKPKIYLPSTLDKGDMEYVISHEKAHLKRLDHVIKPIAFLLLTVYWFNPVLWVAYILLCRDIELACDERVVRKLGEEAKKPYSEALINCSVSRKMIAACPLAFGEIGVKERIKGVLSYKKPAFWIIIVAVAATVITAVLFLTNPPDRKTKNGENLLQITEIEYAPDWTKTKLGDFTDKLLVIENDTEWGVGKSDNNVRKAYVLAYYEDREDDFYIPFLAVETENKVIVKSVDNDTSYTMYGYFDSNDIDGDGENELIWHQNVGMSGGYGQYIMRIFKVKGDNITEMFYSASDNMYDTGFYGVFRDGFKLEIHNRFTDFSGFVDCSRKEKYIGLYFDKNGKALDKNAEIMLDSFYQFYPIDADLDGIFEIRCMQYVSLRDHSDHIGNAISTLKYNNKTKDFEVIEADFEPSNLLSRYDVFDKRYSYSSGIDNASLCLYIDDNTCQLTLSMLSSYYGGGTYEESDEYLVVTTNGGKKYTFKKDGDNLIFNADKSSEVPKYKYSSGAKSEPCIPDGAVFKGDTINVYGYEEYYIMDQIAFDVDGDGAEELCTLTPGWTSGVSSMFLTIKENGETEYNDMFFNEHGDVGFVKVNGKLQIFNETNFGDKLYFDISFDKGHIVLTEIE